MIAPLTPNQLQARIAEAKAREKPADAIEENLTRVASKVEALIRAAAELAKLAQRPR